MDKGRGGRDKTHAAAAFLLLLPLKNPLKLTFKSRPPPLSQCEYNYGKFPRPPPPAAAGPRGLQQTRRKRNPPSLSVKTASSAAVATF